MFQVNLEGTPAGVSPQAANRPETFSGSGICVTKSPEGEATECRAADTPPRAA